jgi:nicotinate-nucleotide adenylyltransferase
VRLGIFGGTFDPPHVGHLMLASDVYEALNLDRLVFVPAGQQPLKRHHAAAPPEARLQMVTELAGSDPRFTVDPTEINRGGLSYTVDTLRWYAEHHADAERFFLLGEDSLLQLESWREASQVVRLARLAVLTRSNGGEAMLDDDALQERIRRLGGAAALEAIRVTARRIDVSSTEVRARVRERKAIRGFVVDAVARYIEDSGLYR